MQFTSASPSIGNAMPHTGDSVAFDFIGGAKHVLIVGGIAASLPQRLDGNGCELTFVLPNAVRSDEARVHSSHVEVADLDEVNVSDLFPDRKFDAVVLDAGTIAWTTASRILDDARRVLSEQGCVVGLMPNVHHGAIRLALLRGLLAGDAFDAVAPELRRFTLDGVVRLFLQTGYDIEAIESATHPIFESSDLLPSLDRAQFSENSVREVEADPDALTLQFVVRALPRSDANADWTADLDRILAEARDRTSQQLADVLPLTPSREETPPNAELEGTRRQAALNAAAASRAQLEVAGLQSQIETLTSQLAESHDALQEQAAATAQAEAHEGDMIARIHELEQLLESIAAESATEIEAQTKDMVARICELENLLSTSRAETQKVLAKADAARAGLDRRNAYIAQLSTMQEATETLLRQANASVSDLQAGLEHANALAEKRSATTSARLALANAALEEQSMHVNALEISEAAARLELWVVRADLKTRLVELESRARALVDEERAKSARLEGALRQTNDELVAVAAQKEDLERAAGRAAEDLDALHSHLRTLEQAGRSAQTRHEQDLEEIASLKDANDEIPILTVRTVKSEKQLEMVEAQLAEMTKRAVGLEDDLLAAVGRELQLQRDAAALDEHARHIESDLHNAARRAEQTERELEEAHRRSALQKDRLAEVAEKAARQNERLDNALSQVKSLTDRLKELESELLAAAGRELELQHDAWRVGERARRLEAEFKQSVHRANRIEQALDDSARQSQRQEEELRQAALQSAQRAEQLAEAEEELRQAALQSAQQAEQLSEASERRAQLEADVHETSLQCARLTDDLAGTSQRCDELAGELAAIHSSRMWRVASALRRALKPWTRG